MSQAKISYRINTEPRRGLATAGIFLIKAIMAVPHLIIVNGLSTLAFGAAYVGYWVVAFTGSLPNSFQDFVTWYLRWQTRTFGWYFGNEDAYPPFEADAPYSIDLQVPRNDAPRTGWAVAGIFLLKFFAAIPHFIVLFVLGFIALVITWFGFIVTAFTGRLPVGIQEFAAGVLQWEARVVAWILGLTDDYPPFSLQAPPAA
ncbi:MAG: DUF4389 domain-containing protein [Actinobacteria bacterium]|nr:DUF4389 domain-containing protein [Actinomycetota bacterium]MBU1492519.1 DUF4389 domain-containing protein [Actinomycetota bacterium]MBU1864844.1 DUF4389 domain-containing protein [Actinomycetota bacterium]